MSNFILPQLLTASDMPQAKAGWLYELKYDGYRAQLHVTASGVRIFTRTGLDWTHRFGALSCEIAKTVAVPCILDGEVFAADSNGRPDFTSLCNSQGKSGDLQFAAFDVLEVDGVSVTSLPLRMRRQSLMSLVPSSSPKVHSVGQSTDPKPLVEFAREHGWEGVVAKSGDSPYLPGTRSPDWRKYKCKRRQEFVIAGWRPDPAKGTLKSLVLATFDRGQLTLRGSVGTGFSHDQRRELPLIFRPACEPRSDLAGLDFVPIEPKLIAEIEYLELSGHGIVRQPNFLGLRADKAARDVSLEA